MNWSDRTKQVIDYIEDHLDSIIDYTEIDRIAICSSGLFGRAFALIVGFPLSEYIRLRRLSEAGQALLSGNDRIIDVALRYGYESPDAFTTAFKKWHGIAPSKARLLAHHMKYYPKLSLNFTIQGGIEMVYRMMDRGPFTVVGKSIRTSQSNNECPHFWDQCFKDKTVDECCKIGQGPLLGVCYDGAKDGSFRYMIGVEAKNNPEGWEKLEVKAARWAIFEVPGINPQAIQEAFKYIFTTFLGTGKYRHDDAPELEVYYSEQKTGCRTEIWVPVLEK